MKMRPYDSPNRKEAFLVGDAVPKPLGFSAFPPEWLFFLGRLVPPRHSGRWLGARVASLRSPILRPGKASINTSGCTPKGGYRKTLAETVAGEVKLIPVLDALHWPVLR
jgi:hypothetical protein